MAEDLVKQLQEQAGSDHMRGCQGRQYSCDCGYDLRTEGLLEQAAASLAAKDKEIERLRASELAKENERLKQWIDLHRGDTMSLSNEVENFRSEMIAAESRAEQTESALAKAVDKTKDEICEALLVISNGWKEQGNTETAMVVSNAAVFTCGVERTKRIGRAFVAQHGSDSREGE